MHQTCSLKRILSWSVPQVYCIVPESRFQAACQSAADGSTLLTALSLSKWSAFPEGAIASILRDASGGSLLCLRPHLDFTQSARYK